MARAIRIPLCAATVAALLLGFAGADEPAKKPDADEDHRRLAEKIVSAIDVEQMVEDKWARSKRIEKPLLYYGDPTRENDRGSVWAWGDKGRPAALLEIYQNANDRTKWVYVICNTSGGKLRASINGREWWKENESASERTDVPGAAVPANDAAGRQRQLKALAQKFTGHEFWDPDNSRFELRRLERPLHTYRDEDTGILDGALYALANGTNPEILLFVEARAGKDGAKSVWQFATGRLAHAELHMAYDGKEVFEAPRGTKLSASDKPYWLGFITTAAEPKKE